MKIPLMVLVSTLGLLISGWRVTAAAEATEAERKEIAELIKNLGSEDFPAREQAQKRLADLGVQSLGALKEAAQGGDPEIRRRSAAIVDQIENADEEALLNGSEYYPLKIGTTWEYKAGPQTTITIKVESHEKVGGRLCAKVVCSINAQPINNECIGARKDGIYRHAYNGFEVKPPLKLIALPVKFGEEWKLESELQNVKITGTDTLGEEKGLQVEAGAFDVITVSSEDTEAGELKISQKSCYAKNVGMVRQDIKMNGQDIHLELLKFIPAEPAAGDAKPK